MIIKINHLRFKPGQRAEWLKVQPAWNRAMPQSAGFHGADILLRAGDPDEVALYERWDSIEADRRFMETGGKKCYAETGVGAMFTEETSLFYQLDHVSSDRRSPTPLWTPDLKFEKTPPSGSRMFVKLLTLKMKPGGAQKWFEKQPYWNRALHDTGGFVGGDILRRVETPNETLLCARWTSREALDHFMKTGAEVMMKKTGVGALFDAEIGRNFELDHSSHERQ